MDQARALDLAAEELAKMQAIVDKVDLDKRRHGLLTSDVEFVVTAVERISETWCVFYNNRAYIDTGKIGHALGGNGPILISTDGRVGIAGTALPVTHYVKEFESSLAPGPPTAVPQ